MSKTWDEAYTPSETIWRCAQSQAQKVTRKVERAEKLADAAPDLVDACKVALGRLAFLEEADAYELIKAALVKAGQRVR